MPAEKVDGNDVELVRAAAREAVDHARRGDGPAFLECLTYRHLGHSKTDPGAYRADGELETWMARDPLTVASERLAQAGMPADEITGREAAVRSDVQAGVALAVADPYPDPGDPPRSTHSDRRHAHRRARRAGRGDAPRRASRAVRRGHRGGGRRLQGHAGLAEEFGDERVFDTPISELALAGAAFGSAVTGLRPVIEIMFGDFMALAMDSLVNQAAKYWYMSNEQAPVPLVVRCAVGAGGRFGAIHSQTPATWLQSVAGLKIVAPAFPDDARGLIAAAVRDPNPVIVLEHKRLYPVKGEIGAEPVEIGSARVARSGADITIVSVMRGVHDALAAADTLAAAGVDAEVIDLRSLRPLDHATVVGSVRKTSGCWRSRRGRSSGLGERPRGRGGGAGAGRPRRRVDADDARHADPLQPGARGCVPAGRRCDRPKRARAAGSRRAGLTGRRDDGQDLRAERG